jgi:methylenetetrahydrofolate dehydrogenase (NADP+)/methenyltetrahydrofolate cyclohydrolase
MKIDGKQIAVSIIARLKSVTKPEKFLAVVLVGEDKNSVSFIGQKEKLAHELGVDFRLYKFPATAKNDELREEVGKIAAHKTCGGVIVQLPLPEGVNRHYVLNAIPPEKDVDVLSERALGAFYAERGRVMPPAVATVEEILKSFNEDAGDIAAFLKTKSVAVVGLGVLVGRPVATWAMWRAKETFLLRSVSDLTIARQVDIVVAGVGKAGLIRREMLKPGAIVIDFGYDGGKGDFAADEKMAADETAVAGKDISYTPTPGGTGPVLVAKLFENFYALNRAD